MLKRYAFLPNLFFLLAAVCLSLKTYALNEKQFAVDYDISYHIQNNGAAEVVQKVTLTNLKNDVVPTSYSFSTMNTKILEIIAESNGKKVTAELNTDEEESGFTVPIINQSIGKDKQNEIIVSYKTDSLMVKTGEVWNIYIPKIQVPSTTNIYNVKVYIPKGLGAKMYFSPTPAVEKIEGDSTVYYLTKNTFKGTGISAAFGESQKINFKIKYQLENKIILPTVYAIPIPSDIKNYQQVAYLELSPKPLNIKKDVDGNFIAYYYLNPKSKIEVTLTGSAKVTTKQIDPDYGGSFSSIPKELIKKYTTEENYWETKSPEIQKVVDSLKNTNMNVTKNAQLAYQYVLDNLEYDFEALKKESVERKGSQAALTQKGKWTCMEYTDLFVALTRAMGIPSREVDGYAFNTGDEKKPLSLSFKYGDLLHAWAEFYDPNYGWVQVDPTWGSTSGIDYFTKVDTNRLSLVVKGVDSENPQPAGTYRFEEGKKLIEIDYNLGQDEKTFEPKIKIEKVFSLNPIQIIKGNRKYKIENQGNVFLYLNKDKTFTPFKEEHIYLAKDGEELKLETVTGQQIVVKY